MFCGNCGAQFEGKFCPRCGTPAFTGEEISASMEYDPKVYEPQGPEPAPPVKKKGKGKLILILGIVAALLVIAGAAFALRDMLPRGGGNAYVYLGRGKYQMLTRLKEDQSAQFASSRSDLVTEQLLAFSPDGKYIYFYTKVDESDYTGTLCRGEYGKFKKDASKNEKYVETIASGVHIGFRMLDNGGVLYMNQSGKLYYYDGKEPSQIARDVSGYYTDGASWLMYLKGNYGEATLYGVSLSDLDEPVKLDKNVAYICGVGDDCLYYIKESTTGDYTQSLYTVSLDRDAERLASDAVILNIDSDGAISYLRKSGSVSLYDYVDDSMAAQDAGITEPLMEDYEIPFYTMNMIRESSPKESDYQGKELYTSCTQPLYWYGQGSGCSMQDAMTRTWQGNNDAIHSTTQDFIDRFGGTADADGFILVTDEVKAALKDINQYGSTASETTWLDMCYVREQSGTTVDYDAYDAAYETYYAASDRIRLRDELRDPANDQPLYTMERYAGGDTQVLAENVLFHEFYGDAVLFCTPDQITERVDLQSASSAYELCDKLRETADCSMYLRTDASLCTFSSKAWDDLRDASMDAYETPAFYEADGTVYAAIRKNQNGRMFCEIYQMEIDDTVVSGLNTVDDDASEALGVHDGALYYMTDERTVDGNTYGDLYECRNGESVRVAQDVKNSGIRIYSDQVVEAITDFEYGDRLEIEITLFSNGEKTILDDEVGQVLRVDSSHYLYINDGDLYCYDGREKTKLQSNVDWVWARNLEEYTEFYGDGSYPGYRGDSSFGFGY